MCGVKVRVRECSEMPAQVPIVHARSRGLASPRHDVYACHLLLSQHTNLQHRRTNSPYTTMKAGSIVALPLTSVCFFLACSAESRPFDTVRKSFETLTEQSPLHDLIMPPAEEVSAGVIISDVIGKTQNIAIFSGLIRDIDDVAGRLDNAGQNATVLAPDNSVMRSLKRKPWEDPEDYDTFGTSAYDGTAGEDRARKNLERFVHRHIVPESPWEEGKKLKTLAGNEIWWESKGRQKKVSYCDLASVVVPDPLQRFPPHTSPLHAHYFFFTQSRRRYILDNAVDSHKSSSSR